MYRFSLASFVQLFKATLEEDGASPVPVLQSSTTATATTGTLDDRLRRLTPALLLRTLYYVGRALFKGDRTTYALHLARGMRPDLFDSDQNVEWGVFTGVLAGGSGESQSANGFSGELSETGRARDLPSWAATERCVFMCVRVLI
jgi:dynein heavy chain 2, cytosolic